MDGKDADDRQADAAACTEPAQQYIRANHHSHMSKQVRHMPRQGVVCTEKLKVEDEPRDVPGPPVVAPWDVAFTLKSPDVACERLPPEVRAADQVVLHDLFVVIDDEFAVESVREDDCSEQREKAQEKQIA